MTNNTMNKVTNNPTSTSKTNLRRPPSSNENMSSSKMRDDQHDRNDKNDKNDRNERKGNHDDDGGKNKKKKNVRPESAHRKNSQADVPNTLHNMG
jgi:hypothetical protein